HHTTAAISSSAAAQLGPRAVMACAWPNQVGQGSQLPGHNSATLGVCSLRPMRHASGSMRLGKNAESTGWCSKSRVAIYARAPSKVESGAILVMEVLQEVFAEDLHEGRVV